MKKLIFLFSLVLFMACSASEVTGEKTEDIKKSYEEEKIEIFMNMELGEQRWLYTNVAFIRIMGGWLVIHQGVCFIPYDIVQREAKELAKDE